MTFSITQSSTYSPSPVLRAPPVIKATYLHTEVEHSSVLHRRVPLFDQSSEETAPRTVQVLPKRRKVAKKSGKVPCEESRAVSTEKRKFRCSSSAVTDSSGSVPDDLNTLLDTVSRLLFAPDLALGAARKCPLNRWDRAFGG